MQNPGFTITIKESYLECDTWHDSTGSSSGGGGGSGCPNLGNWNGADCEAIIIVVVVVLTVVIVWALVEKVFIGRDIYVHPAGFGDEYRQQLYFGKNKVFLPRQFALEGGILSFTVSGTYEGSWYLVYKPGVDNYLLD